MLADLDFLIGALRYPAHPYFSIKDLKIDLLVKSLWVLLGAMGYQRENFFTSQGKTIPSGIIETSSPLLISLLLIGSERLTLISKSQVQRELQEGVLAVLPIPMSHASRPIGITMHKDGDLPKDNKGLLISYMKRLTT